ncbi:MAG: hypothetical protein FD146_2104 [Anaerolineaceae bacterium]|nr:MAG: hypothetical protein FD146_2104 [Anaerolineaceae bacterium]
MRTQKFVLPHAAFPQLKKIIVSFDAACNRENRAISVLELSEMAELSQRQISGCVGFLQNIGVLEVVRERSYRMYHMTEFGAELASTINKSAEESSRCWEKVVKETVFLREVLSKIHFFNVQEGPYNQDELKHLIVSMAGRLPLAGKPPYNALIGAKTILDVMEDGKAITRQGKNYVVNDPEHDSTDKPPDFSRLISDPRMQLILRKRWIECSLCVSKGAPLAATVMMGGLLESLLFAKVQQQPDKNIVFNSRSAPFDQDTQKVKDLKKWHLQDYIAVAHELKWVSESVRNIADVLRDYRNLIHPYEQFSRNIDLVEDDAHVFWQITMSISRQLLA